jgi:hypothetical protein
MDVPWRRDFDAARDPYTARNALGITSLGGGGISDAPSDGTLYGRLNGAWSPAQAAGSYAPINSPTFTGDPKAPTPATADNDTSIATTAYVKANLANYQPLDADLTSIAGYGGTGTWLYRSGTDTWSPVTIGSGLTFTAGTLAATGGGGGTATVTAPQGRLTLTTGMPVMTASVSGATTIYYSAYVGNLVPIYDGSNFTMTALPSSEISTTTTDTTKNPAAIGASKVNDWFVWNDGGTVRLCHGPDWTNDSTRSAGTALVKVNGIDLNNASITNGPAAQRGTWVGTTRSGSGSTLFHIFPTSDIGGNFGVWNTYNRVEVGGTCQNTTVSWAIASTTVRLKASSANYATGFVSGSREDIAHIFNAHGLVVNASDGTTIICGIGVDTTTLFSVGGGQGTSGASANAGVPFAEYKATSFGYHTWYCLEAGNTATSVTTFSNLTGPPVRVASYHTFSFKM